MSDFVFYLMVGGIITFILVLVIKPLREMLFQFVGATSLWSFLWALVMTLVSAHFIVLKNFLPRGFIYPTLDDRKVTNAED